MLRTRPKAWKQPETGVSSQSRKPTQKYAPQEWEGLPCVVVNTFLRQGTKPSLSEMSNSFHETLRGFDPMCSSYTSVSPLPKQITNKRKTMLGIKLSTFPKILQVYLNSIILKL